jgi:enoyl-CoA hydratase
MTEPELIVSRHRRLGHIRLNRPKALNSLTLDMVRLFTRALKDFAPDPGVVAVLVTGEGERGLCAGGDIRRLYELRGGDNSYYRRFWREEYQLNAQIAVFPKPYVVWMDGLVMGGGVGVSAHGNCRIVTERTCLAMPEVGIGFIPDVGGTWLLSRAGGVGFYMALSGAAVSGRDAIDAGLADMMIDSGRRAEVVERLAAIDAATDVSRALHDLLASPAPGPLMREKQLLDEAMMTDDVATALRRLGEDRGNFARSAAAEIDRNSPTSLKVTFALLRRAASARRLEDCLVNEYRAACRMLQGPDLYEGIRAAIIDKDKSPKWSPPTLDEISDDAVSAILAGDGSAEPVFPGVG